MNKTITALAIMMASFAANASVLPELLGDAANLLI